MFDYMKKWADKWDVKGEVKCKDEVQLRHDHLVVTSNVTIREAFHSVLGLIGTEGYNTALEAISRRFEVIHFTKEIRDHPCSKCNPQLTVADLL
jgi:hypothetical protein